MALFSSFGKISRSEMSMDSSTGRSKGFCFLEYADIASADAAQAMNGFELAGRKVTLFSSNSYVLVLISQHFFITDQGGTPIRNIPHTRCNTHHQPSHQFLCHGYCSSDGTEHHGQFRSWATNFQSSNAFIKILLNFRQ